MSRRSHNVGNPSTPPDSEILNSHHSADLSDNNSSMEVRYKKRETRKRKRDNSSQGRWTDEEHRQFVEGIPLINFLLIKIFDFLPIFYSSCSSNTNQTAFLGLKICGKNWKKLEHYVPTRNSTQIRSHAQKFFIKIERQHHVRDALEHIRRYVFWDEWSSDLLLVISLFKYFEAFKAI